MLQHHFLILTKGIQSCFSSCISSIFKFFCIFAEYNDNSYEVKDKHSIKELLAWLWRTSKGARTQAVVNAVVGIVDVVCQLLWVFACKRAIDIATGEVEGDLLITGVVIAALMLVEISCRSISRWINSIWGVRTCNKMRHGIFSHLLRGEWFGLKKHHTGDLINRLEIDVNDITTLITSTIPQTLVIGIQLIGSFALLFYLSPMLAIAIVFILPVCLLISKMYVNRMRRYNREVRESDSRIQSVLQESLQHKALIKTMEQNEHTEGRLSELQDGLHAQVRNRTKFSLGAFALIQLGFAAGYLVAFLWGANGIKEGVITFGTLTAYLQLVNLIQGPTMNLSRSIPSMVSSLTAVERLMELMEIPTEERGEKQMITGVAGVRFEDVDFKYADGDKNILEKFNYDFPPGSITAIIGETGAGKTTLIRLLVALVHPDGGKIEIYNGKESVTSSPLTRCNFVYIPQGNSLISGTIRQNVLMGNPDATEEEINNALHTACADFVFDLPDGIDTELAEQGNGLSEGQAQRIAVARSLLRPGSILILDEVTSALDETTEEEMLRRLADSSTGKTLIFVTHRPAVIKYCTQTMKIGELRGKR